MTEIINSINWTTVFSSGVIAVILGIAQVISNRYTNRALDHLEKLFKTTKQKEDK
jgi:hypothetical protein